MSSDMSKATMNTVLESRGRKRRMMDTDRGILKEEMIRRPQSIYLTKDGVEAGLRQLSSSDSRLERLIRSCKKDIFDYVGPKRESCSFTSLCRSICSQQLHTKAAATIYARVKDLCADEATGFMLPENVHNAPLERLQEAGLSSSKIQYLKDLSDHYIRGSINEDMLLAADDLETLRCLLLPVKGIGPWTVDMFAIFHLKFADVLPVSDLGVRKGMQKIYGLKGLPNPKQMGEIAEPWKPYRSLGAWFCWRALEPS